MCALNDQDAVCQELIVPQTEVYQICYDTCGPIDQHNYHCHYTLKIEKNK